MEQLPRRLHHEHDCQMLLRIAPKRRSSGAEPVIVAWRPCFGRDSLLAPHREAEAESVARPRQIVGWSGANLTQMVRGHERNRCGAQNAVTVENATILQHLHELRVVEGGRNHALPPRLPFGGKPRVSERLCAYYLVVGR